MNYTLPYSVFIENDELIIREFRPVLGGRMVAIHCPVVGLERNMIVKRLRASGYTFDRCVREAMEIFKGGVK